MRRSRAAEAFMNSSLTAGLACAVAAHVAARPLDSLRASVRTRHLAHAAATRPVPPAPVPLAPARTPVAPTFTPEPMRWFPFELTLNSGDRISVDTARLTVPERYDAPNAALIRLPVLRLRTTAARPGPPIVYLAGGPGSNGIPTSADISPLILELRMYGDVLLYDQRGTGRALPSLMVPARIGIPADVLLASDSARMLLRRGVTSVVADMKARGVDLNAYNTENSADDLDALRESIGATTLVVWGHSYGSHLALSYLRRHEAHVARLLIGGVNGPDDRWRPPADGDVLLARIDSAIRADKRAAAVIPDFLGLARRVMTRLRSTPLVATVDGRSHAISADEVATLIALSTGEIEFVRRVPQLFVQLDAGDGIMAARMIQNTVRDRQLGTSMTYAMHLASGVSPARAARIAAEAPKAILGNAINWPWDLPEFVEPWGIRRLPDAFREPVRSAVPAMLYSGTYDGRTSIGDAEAVRAGLRNSTHVIVDGASHGSHLQSAELRRLMVEFVSGTTPPAQHLSVALDLRSPDEVQQIGALMTAANGGPEALVAHYRELLVAKTRGTAPWVTSYVAGSVAVNLLSMKKNTEALALLDVAVTSHPMSAFLFERLGDARAALADTSGARRAYAQSNQLDPMSLRARNRLRELSAASRSP